MKRMLFLGLGVVVLLTSCVKNKVAPTGDAHVRFVNAVNGSVAQDIYIDNVLANTSSLSFGSVTNYYTYVAGLNLLTFTNTGTTVSNISYTYGSNIGDYATVYLYTDSLNNLGSGGIKDDMSAPATGKARVRFINLQSHLRNTLKMTVTGGADLFTYLAFGAASSYYDVAPGSTFTPSSPGLTAAPVIDPQVQAGKIYTIWLSGTKSTELYGYSILQNQ